MEEKGRELLASCAWLSLVLSLAEPGSVCPDTPQTPQQDPDALIRHRETSHST